MENVNERQNYNIKDIIKRAILALSIPTISIIYIFLNKNRTDEHVLITYFDIHIPFIKYFVIPYLLWYLYVGIFLMTICVIDKKSYYKLLINICTGMLICYAIYYIFPTYTPRPQIYGKDICSRLIAIIYQNDNPYNCFPSIHVINSMFIAIYVNRQKRFKTVVKVLSVMMTVIIIASTFFIKQHLIVDALSGILLAYSIYFLTEFITRRLN